MDFGVIPLKSSLKMLIFRMRAPDSARVFNGGYPGDYNVRSAIYCLYSLGADFHSVLLKYMV